MDDDQVMTFDQWCKLNCFSRSTGQRLIASGEDRSSSSYLKSERA